MIGGLPDVVTIMEGKVRMAGPRLGTEGGGSAGHAAPGEELRGDLGVGASHSAATSSAGGLGCPSHILLVPLPPVTLVFNIRNPQQPFRPWRHAV